MKKLFSRRIVRLGALLIIVALLVSGCGREEQEAETDATENPADDNGNTIKEEDATEVENGDSEETRIILNMNGTEIRGSLNATAAAESFKELLPFSITVSRAADDLCGSVSQQLNVDPGENRNSWKLGEIGWFGGWFTILLDHEDNFSSMPGITIIGTIDEEDLETVQSFSGRIDISVDLAE